MNTKIIAILLIMFLMSKTLLAQVYTPDSTFKATPYKGSMKLSEYDSVIEPNHFIKINENSFWVLLGKTPKLFSDFFEVIYGVHLYENHQISKEYYFNKPLKKVDLNPQELIFSDDTLNYSINFHKKNIDTSKAEKLDLKWINHINDKNYYLKNNNEIAILNTDGTYQYYSINLQDIRSIDAIYQHNKDSVFVVFTQTLSYGFNVSCGLLLKNGIIKTIYETRSYSNPQKIKFSYIGNSVFKLEYYYYIYNHYYFDFTGKEVTEKEKYQVPELQDSLSVISNKGVQLEYFEKIGDYYYGFKSKKSYPTYYQFTRLSTNNSGRIEIKLPSQQYISLDDKAYLIANVEYVGLDSSKYRKVVRTFDSIPIKGDTILIGTKAGEVYVDILDKITGELRYTHILSIIKIPQTISFTKLPQSIKAGDWINIEATSSSGLPVKSTIEFNNKTYQLQGTKEQISIQRVLVYKIEGKIWVTYIQEGNDKYAYSEVTDSTYLEDLGDIENKLIEDIIVFPNPTKFGCWIRFDDVLPYSLTIFDIFGNEVETIQTGGFYNLNGVSQIHYQNLNLHGYYYFHFRRDNFVKVIKVYFE